MKYGKHQYQGVVVSLLALVLLTFTGCMPGTTQTDTSMAGTDGSLAISSTVGNYEDIELPSEMKYNPKNSMSIKTSSFRGGIIHYTGRVEMHSLKEFIIASMKKNKWKLAGEVSSQNVILAFTKPNKTCMMNIEPNGAMSDTTLTMYVTVDVTAARALNAFGEPIQ
ncbi:hypothetical protein UWK_03142 [Desulfocapsa sulfexigens DSM 10523]|uniref:Lipoprotein n=1 Tax=Desulfocapsa sulfexigens (strain DSM 10523 / SB164P1) TaxID=1167006 RepID=M1PTJ6_DESSD|nr:hypothetical protein [Desulfocapsa sulfexigens]AGF79671.1 hypothetical protein UWK_03142 [Desulfocapsa sulfexigens DSM 10523]